MQLLELYTAARHVLYDFCVKPMYTAMCVRCDMACCMQGIIHKQIYKA